MTLALADGTAHRFLFTNRAPSSRYVRVLSYFSDRAHPLGLEGPALFGTSLERRHNDEYRFVGYCLGEESTAAWREVRVAAQRSIQIVPCTYLIPLERGAYRFRVQYRGPGGHTQELASYFTVTGAGPRNARKAIGIASSAAFDRCNLVRFVERFIASAPAAMVPLLADLDFSDRQEARDVLGVLVSVRGHDELLISQLDCPETERRVGAAEAMAGSSIRFPEAAVVQAVTTILDYAATLP